MMHKINAILLRRHLGCHSPDGPHAGAAAAIVLASPCWPRRVGCRRHVSCRRSRPPLTAGSAPAAPPGMEEKARGDWGGRQGREGKVVGEKRDSPRHAIGIGERRSMMWMPCQIDGVDAVPDPHLVSLADRPLPKSGPSAS